MNAKERIRAALRECAEEELRALREDAARGAITELIEERLAEIACAQNVCPVCGAPTNPEKDLTLTFGDSLRYRASFDGRDCLAAFLASLLPTKGRVMRAGGAHEKARGERAQGLNTQSE